MEEILLRFPHIGGYMDTQGIRYSKTNEIAKGINLRRQIGFQKWK